MSTASRSLPDEGGPVIKKLLIGAAVAAIAVLAVREYPALRREIKMWRM